VFHRKKNVFGIGNLEDKKIPKYLYGTHFLTSKMVNPKFIKCVMKKVFQNVYGVPFPQTGYGLSFT